MSVRKVVQFDAHQFERVAMVRAPSEQVRADSEGLVEDPPLLESFRKLIEAIAEAAPTTLRLREIRGVDGAYVCEILGIGGITAARETIVALLDRYKDAAIILELNAQREEPATASACGVSAASLAVLQIASALNAAKHQIEVVLTDGEKREVVAPTSMALTALPAESNPRDRKVDGKITGIGLSNKHGCRLEVGRKSTFVVPKLKLEAAWELLKRNMTVFGIAKWDGQDYVLDGPTYGAQPDLGNWPSGHVRSESP